MRRTFLLSLGAMALTVGCLTMAPDARAQVPYSPRMMIDAEPPRFPDFNTVIKGAKEHEGLFKLYHKDDHVYMEIMPHQFNRPLLCPIAVARGSGMGGMTLNNEEQWVLLFKRAGDKVQLIRRNVHFKAKHGTPVAKAVEITYSDSVLMALKIVTLNP